MSLSAVAAAALFGQSIFVTVPTNDLPSPDVAYEELKAGHADAAVRKLEAASAIDQKDPAVLINRGTAYRMAGRLELARASYQAAADSPERYDLEMIDGTWADSRQIALQALRGTRVYFADRSR